MIKEAGTIRYTWDDAGHLKTLQSALYEESVPEDGFNAAGKLLKFNRGIRWMKHYANTLMMIYLTSQANQE